GLDLPPLRAAMWAVDAELTAGGAGGRLAAESLANVVAVHLIRHVLAPRSPARRRDGTLPRGRLRAVVAYIEGPLDAGPSLEQVAAVARLSAYHFARQFKAATGLPPYQYVILRRVERARQLLQAGTDLSLAEVAAHAGFSDQSQFTHHFKRLVGVTPGQFRTSARIAKKGQVPPRNARATPLPLPVSRVGRRGRAAGAAPARRTAPCRAGGCPVWFSPRGGRRRPGGPRPCVFGSSGSLLLTQEVSDVHSQFPWAVARRRQPAPRGARAEAASFPPRPGSAGMPAGAG